MGKDNPLAAFGRGLHQDADIGVETVADLARNLLSGMTDAERTALRFWLDSGLERYTPSELKGFVNRATSDLYFSSKGAAALLQAAADQLRSA